MNDWTKHIGDYKELFDFVWHDERFEKCSGASSSRGHHYGQGGLKEHTEEVVNFCMMHANAQSLGHWDTQDLFFAAVWHDYGKIFDYTILVDDFGLRHWGKADHYYKIHHVSRSAAEWLCKARQVNYPEDRIMKVLHAILAHHQLPEWGSPVEPRTKIAWILHLCDNMSARMFDGGNYH